MPVPPNDHPCFDPAARPSAARVHLPVAPACNIACNYCDRRSDCVAESRPGVSSTTLTPHAAADYLDRVAAELPQLSVVGIAGPGDPFANSEQTLATLRLARERHPELLLCLATNGLALPAHLDELARLEVSHVTVTVNTVDPAVGARIYRWVRDGTVIHRGIAAAELLLQRQLAGIEGLVQRGIAVKINTILVPGLTVDGVEEVARAMAGLGATAMNCVPLYPVAGTPFGALGSPDPGQVAAARRAAGRHLTQLTHCARCRADAVGLLGERHDQARLARLLAARPPRSRPYVAVTSQEGLLVNQHLGGAEELLIYEPIPDGVRLRETRPAPAAGGGDRRWAALAALLGDCSTLLVNQVGAAPRGVLDRAGIAVHETEGLIREAVGDVFAGRVPRRVLPQRSCEDSCSGPGTGCG